MKLTIQDYARILGFLEITRNTTKTAIEKSGDRIYKEIMEGQLHDIDNIIWKIEHIEP